MSDPFVPQSDAALRSFAATLAAKAGASDGLSVAMISQLGSAYSGYDATLTTALDPATRTRPAIIAKDAAKTYLIAVVRMVARVINANPAVTNERRAELGLTVRKPRSPIPAPADAPLVDLESVVASTIHVRLHDGTVGRRGKPAGVAGARIHTFVGETPPTQLEQWQGQYDVSRPRTSITFPDVTPGAKVWLIACWFNAKQENGPLCAPVGTNLPGGVSSLQASSRMSLALPKAA